MSTAETHDDSIRIIDSDAMEQGSLEWHELRSKHYPASEAGAVMEVNPWQPKNQRELFAVRNGELFIPENPFMARGKRLEEPAREHVIEWNEVEVAPVIAVRGKFMASLDGFGILRSGQTFVAEIKVPKNPEKLYEAIEQEKLPENYFWQLVQQAYCSGADFVSFSAHEFDEHENHVGAKYMLLRGKVLREHWPTLQAAWETFESTNHEPIEIRRADSDWLEASRAYSEAKEAIRRARQEAGLAKLEKAEKEAKDRLLELADEQIRTTGFGVTVSPYETKAYSVEASVKRRVSGSFEEPQA